MLNLVKYYVRYNKMPSRKKSRRKSRKKSRKNPMKGWTKMLSPRTQSERRKLKARCGSKCFLRPSTNSFPICAKNSCTYNCKGLLAAKTRARQFKYTSIASKAQRLAREKGCSWAKKSKRRKSRRKSRRRRSRSRSVKNQNVVNLGDVNK